MAIASNEIAYYYRPPLLYVLLGCSIVASVIDFLSQARQKERYNWKGSRGMYCQRRTVDKKDDVKALIGDEQENNCRTSTPVGVYLTLTRVNALPIWLCVNALELTSVIPPVDMVAYSPLSTSFDGLQAGPCIAFLIVFVVLLSTSLFTLLLVAKRSCGLQKTIILAVYSLSATVGILFWGSMGMTEAETFAVFIPLTMSIGASIGQGIHAYMRSRNKFKKATKNYMMTK